MKRKIQTKTNKYQIGGEVLQVGSAEKTLIKGLELDADIVRALTADDDDPMFVTVEVIRPETSGNKRFYSIEELRSIERQINEKLPNGYQGHLKTEDRDTANPDAVTQWLKAVIVEKDGKPTLFAKGYVFAHQEKFREYLRKSIALRKRVAVSVYGTAKGIINKLTGVTEVKNFMLESIDWARYMSEGMQGQIVPIIAKEQQEENLEEAMLTKEELLQALKDFAERGELTASEIQEALPEMEFASAEPASTATGEETPSASSEPTSENNEVTPEPTVEPAEPKTDEDGEVVKEMVEKNELDVVVSEMQAIKSERDELLQDYMANQIAKTFTNEKIQKVVKPLVVAEMQGDGKQAIDTAIEAVANSEEIKEIVAEMNKQPLFNPLNDNRPFESKARKYTTVGAKKS